MYQLIALDMDGTLLNSKKEVSSENLAAIRQVAAAGKKIVYCTGRAVTEMSEYFDWLPEIEYAVFASGAGILHIPTRKVLSLRPLPRAQADAVIALAKTKDLMPQLVLADRDVIQASHMANLAHFHMEIYRPLYKKAMTLVPDIYAFFDACRDDILKINLYHAEAAERERTRETLSAIPMEMMYSEVSSLECSAKGVDKGSGLIRLCALLGISMEACIAVGDAENDIPMIRAAGLGIAMGNATEQVRSAADRTVAGNDQDGCAQALRLML